MITPALTILSGPACRWLAEGMFLLFNGDTFLEVTPCPKKWKPKFPRKTNA